MEIAPSARKHGISDDDMIHAFDHPLKEFTTEHPDVSMLVGPTSTGDLIEIAVVERTGTERIIHAMPARRRFLKGWLIR